MWNVYIYITYVFQNNTLYPMLLEIPKYQTKQILSSEVNLSKQKKKSRDPI